MGGGGGSEAIKRKEGKVKKDTVNRIPNKRGFTDPIHSNTRPRSLVKTLLDSPCLTSLLKPTASSKL